MYNRNNGTLSIIDSSTDENKIGKITSENNIAIKIMKEQL